MSGRSQSSKGPSIGIGGLFSGVTSPIFTNDFRFSGVTSPIFTNDFRLCPADARENTPLLPVK